MGASYESISVGGSTSNMNPYQCVRTYPYQRVNHTNPYQRVHHTNPYQWVYNTNPYQSHLLETRRVKKK